MARGDGPTSNRSQVPMASPKSSFKNKAMVLVDGGYFESTINHILDKFKPERRTVDVKAVLKKIEEEFQVNLVKRIFYQGQDKGEHSAFHKSISIPPVEGPGFQIEIHRTKEQTGRLRVSIKNVQQMLLSSAYLSLVSPHNHSRNFPLPESLDSQYFRRP